MHIRQCASAVSHIPTLSEWGMIAAAVGLGFVGVFFGVRKRSAITS
ncbi:MAG: IPTL-CTERM sorting domain-containing protein [Thermodesulfobacteriota bacterium]